MVTYKKVFEAPVGSVNYNTNDERSDKDKKLYEYPTFDELFDGKMVPSIAYKDEEGDVERHDIRKLPNMLYKANVNFLELLFAHEFTAYDPLYHQLRERREEIGRMNLPYLYEACIGMFDRKYKELKRDISYLHETDFSEAELADIKLKIQKNSASAYRILNFLMRYQSNDFKSFENAMRYRDEEPARKYILSLRKDWREPDQVLSVLLAKKTTVVHECREVYRSHAVDEELNKWMRETVRDAVKQQLL